jgi:ligand-binding SRPBCC domain-containing protein
MPTIYLTTEINASIQRCFDLSRSIDLHVLSTKKTHETAVAGVTSGLIGLNEEVTWRARHFGIYQQLTTRITAFQSPIFFEDQMVKGVFKKIEHKHFFEQQGLLTIMKDEFYFEAPFGIIGKFFSTYILVHHLQSFLKERNALIKKAAESNEWKKILTK